MSASFKLLVIALYVVPMASSAGDEESRMGSGGEIVGGLGTRGSSGGLVGGLGSIESSEGFSAAFNP